MVDGEEDVDELVKFITGMDGDEGTGTKKSKRQRQKERKKVGSRSSSVNYGSASCSNSTPSCPETLRNILPSAVNFSLGSAMCTYVLDMVTLSISIIERLYK